MAADALVHWIIRLWATMGLKIEYKQGLILQKVSFQLPMPEYCEIMEKQHYFNNLQKYSVPEGIIFNSLVPGGSECDSKNLIFNLVLLIGIFRSSHDNALPWMPQNLTDGKSKLVHVMAWCH